MTAEQLQKLIEQYLKLFPAERERLQLLLDQLAAGEKMDDRYNFRGHITGSGLVISPNRAKVLLIHHKGSGNWQQPGGHWEDEADESPLDAARREVIEETAAQLEAYVPFDAERMLLPLDIDTHWIPHPRHADEQPHYHHDFLYAFVASSEGVAHQAEEVHGAAWFALDAPECGHPKMQRALTKLRTHDLI